MDSTEVIMSTICLTIMLGWFPITHYDYPMIRYMQKVSPEHRQHWMDAREELGVANLRESA